MIHWLTPFSIKHMNQHVHHFPPSIITCEHILLTCSVTPQTLSNYVAGLLRFTKFCNDSGIMEDLRMPASEDLLCIFIMTHGAGRVGYCLLSNWLLGLEMWHLINSAPWMRRAHLARAVKGSATATPLSSSCSPRPPVTFTHLNLLHDTLNLSNTFDTLLLLSPASPFGASAA